MKTRTNAEWLAALTFAGEAQGSALSELRGYLLRAAPYALYRSRSALRSRTMRDVLRAAT
jgi:hypothetical protein